MLLYPCAIIIEIWDRKEPMFLNFIVNLGKILLIKGDKC